MEVTLSGIGVGLGLLGAVVSFLVPVLLGPPGRPALPRVWPGLVAGGLLVLAAFLATLPTQAPFSAGQRLGWGFVVGGGAALVAALLCSFLPREERPYQPYPAGVTLGLALGSASLAFLLFRGDPGDALLGAALGWALVAGVAATFSAPGVEPDLTRATEAGAALAATLAAACVLGVHHYPGPGQRGWWAFPLALAAFWLAGHVLSYLAASRPGWGRRWAPQVGVAAAAGAVLAFGLGSMMAARLTPSEPLEAILGSAIVAGALILWLALSAEQEGGWPAMIQAAGLGVLLALLLVTFSFKLMAGFGTALALLAAWPALAAGLAAPAAGGARSGHGGLPMQCLLMGAGLLLVKVFLERSGVRLGEVQLSFHYTVVGVALGALLPLTYPTVRLAPGVLRVLAVGALGAGTPVLVLTLWGPDAMLGLLIGLAVCQGLVALARAFPGDGQAELWQAPMSVVALGMGLVGAQFSRAGAFLYQLPRATKAQVALAVGVVGLLWLIGVALAQLRLRRRAASAGEG